MFGRKKEVDNEKEKIKPSFENWDKELGFLNLILSRKKNVTIEFLVNTLSSQKGPKDYLSDEDIEGPIANITMDVFNSLGTMYKEFLITKYFGSKEQLLAFIAEDVYVDLVATATKLNKMKVSSLSSSSFAKRIISSNTTTKKSASK